MITQFETEIMGIRFVLISEGYNLDDPFDIKPKFEPLNWDEWNRMWDGPQGERCLEIWKEAEAQATWFDFVVRASGFVVSEHGEWSLRTWEADKLMGLFPLCDSALQLSIEYGFPLDYATEVRLKEWIRAAVQIIFEEMDSELLEIFTRLLPQLHYWHR